MVELREAHRKALQLNQLNEAAFWWATITERAQQIVELQKLDRGISETDSREPEGRDGTL